MIEDLENEILSYITVGKFLTGLKKEFGEENNETIKVAKLKKIEQGEKMMEEFVQKFKRVAKRSRYERRPLVEEFKQDMNEIIRQKMMEPEYPSQIIE